MPLRAEGLLHSRFSWTFEPSADIGSDGVTPRGAFAAHAVVELPPDREALSGTLSGTVRAERHGFSLAKGPTSRSVADVPFSATYARGRQRDVDTERGVRLFVVTEVDAYERLGIDHAERTQRWLDQVVAEAVARTGVRDVVSQPRGASIVSTFPPGTDEGTALSRFYSGLLDAIADIADQSLVDQPLRLRVGMSSGQSSRGTTGWSGRAAECAATLVGVDVVRETLAGSPDAVVVLAVSDALYHDVVRDLRRPPRAAGFRRVDLGGRVHGTDTAWVHVASA